MRRKSDWATWENTIEALAMDLCPAEEWQLYQNQLRHVTLSSPCTQARTTATIKVFPIWRKYRSKALKVATLQQTIPLLRHLPLSISRLLGDILFK